ncbi:MAG: SDR family oxidoreductase [Rhodococcus sp. (in: high G+C Gram-positive bacteria)]
MKSVLVSGAGRGIGLACTRRLAASGITVFGGARSREHLDLLADMPGVHPVRLDVTDASSVAALADVLPSELHGVVNNAGIAVQGPVEAVPMADAARQFDVNVLGTMRLTRAVLPRIRQGGGRIVMISSMSGTVATPGTGTYSASKFALEALTDALRIELRPWRIPVSLIQPGTIETDMWTEVLTDFDAAAASMTPEHRRLYEPQLTRMRALLPTLQRGAIDPDRVARRVEHALTSHRPRRRYRCDALSTVQLIATSVAPTAVTDAVLSAITSGRRMGPR